MFLFFALSLPALPSLSYCPPPNPLDRQGVPILGAGEGRASQLQSKRHQSLEGGATKATAFGKRGLWRGGAAQLRGVS